MILSQQGFNVTDIDMFLTKTPDEKPVRLFLPILKADNRLLIQCIFKPVEGKYFQLQFKSGSLPVSQIDQQTSCIINLDVGGQSVSMESKIFQIVNSQTLEMVPQKTISHEQMREFFRVDCTVPIMLKSMVPDAIPSAL